MYKARGFVVNDYHADNEFNLNELRSALDGATLHICAPKEKVGTIEREIRTVKERTRCTCHAVPFEFYTKVM